MTSWTADPLTWGAGPTVFEAFLEPTCPFSGLAFSKIFDLLDQAGTDVITVKIRLNSQPWHLFSGIITRLILAASTLSEGREASRQLMAAIYDRREEFVFENHCAGPNLDTTPNILIRYLEEITGLPLGAAFLIPDLDREMKMHARYARQNGIHVSPTFMIDGLVRSDIGSGDAVGQWLGAMNLSQPSS